MPNHSDFLLLATQVLNARLKIDNQQAVQAAEAQYIRAIEAIDCLEMKHETDLEKAHAETESERERIYTLNDQMQSAWDNEIASYHELIALNTSRQAIIQELIQSANTNYTQTVAAKEKEILTI